jgi:hypothetical protein
MTTRIYYVTASADGEARLVRAASPAQAIRHVALDRYRCRVARQETIVEMLSAGDPVETAGEWPDDPGPTPGPVALSEPEPVPPLIWARGSMGEAIPDAQEPAAQEG